MYSWCKYIIHITLILFVLTLLTVSYVGVYLTYIALPVIIVSGLLMKITKKKKVIQEIEPVSSTLTIILNEANSGLERFNAGMDCFNESMHWFNEKNRIINERTQPHNERIRAIRRRMIEPEVRFKYEEDPDKRKLLSASISKMEEEMRGIDREKEKVKMAVEIEIARRRQVY